MTVFFAPIDHSDDDVNHCIRLIAQSIPQPSTIIDVMQRAGLDASSVDLGGASFDVWKRIVQQASDNFEDHILLDSIFATVPRLESQLAVYDPVAGVFNLANDDPEVDREELKELVAILADHIDDVDVIRRVVDRTPGLDFNFADTSPRLLWAAIVSKAAQDGVLHHLYQRAAMGRNVIRQRFVAHLSAVTAARGVAAGASGGDGPWYPPVERSSARFFGRRRHIPAIDRDDVRDGLDDLRQGYLSCLLVGGTHPGADHTREFVRFYANRNPAFPSDFQPYVIRPNKHVEPTAAVIMEDIAATVGFALDAASADEEQPAATAKRLAHSMLRGLRTASGSGWIVIYVNDPNSLSGCARELIDQLALQFGDGNMDRRFALIVIGLDELPDLDLDPVGHAVLGPIGAADVRAFYVDVAAHVGRELVDSQLDALVQSAEEHLTDMSSLKRHVADECAALFGAP